MIASYYRVKDNEGRAYVLRKSMSNSLSNKILLLSVAITLSCCSPTKIEPRATSCEHKSSPHFTWTKADGKVKGVFIVAHGLNNHAEVMRPLIKVLSSQGFHSVLVTLTGHQSVKEMSEFEISPETWLEDILLATCLAKKSFPEQPLYGMGFSAGGAALVSVLKSSLNSKLEKLILFAPSLSIRTAPSLVRLLLPLRFFGLSLPSLAPPSYQAHSSTSLQAYHALMRNIDYLATVPRHVNVPTLVFSSPKDFLVSFSGLKKWIKKNKLSNWILVPISPKKDGIDKSLHIIIDDSRLNSTNWALIGEQIQSFLTAH